jgi:hypothetical protein
MGKKSKTPAVPKEGKDVQGLEGTGKWSSKKRKRLDKYIVNFKTYKLTKTKTNPNLD